SALDHLVYDLSGGIEDCEFPIYDDMRHFFATARTNRWPKGSGLHKIRGITNDRAWSCIEAMQPYNHGERAHSRGLWVLHELANIDKHRTLHLCRRRAEEAQVGVPNLVHGDFEITIPWELEKRTVLSWYSVRDPEVEVDVEGGVSLYIAFDKGSLPTVIGKRVDSICKILLGQVLAVVADLEAVV
ncbi:MAG TPA: hypothetical protein VH700_00795, partial [Gemmatimonadales bacterium]